MRRKTLFYTVRLYHDFSEGCKPISHCDFLLFSTFSCSTLFVCDFLPWTRLSTLSPVIHLPLTLNFTFNSIQFQTNWMPIDFIVGEPNSIVYHHTNSIPIDLVVGEPNHPLHGHLLPHSAHLLLAVGQRGEGGQHQHHQHLHNHHDRHQHVHNRPKLAFVFFCAISCPYYL